MQIELLAVRVHSILELFYCWRNFLLVCILLIACIIDGCAFWCCRLAGPEFSKLIGALFGWNHVILLKPLWNLNFWIASPLSRLTQSRVKFSALSLSSYSRLRSSWHIFVARLCIFSIRLISFLRYGFHAWHAYSKWGRMYEVQSILVDCFVQNLKFF